MAVHARQFTLDPQDRRLRADTVPAAGGAATRSLTRHYTDASDSPAWMDDSVSGQVTRYLQTLGGGLGAQVTTTGSVSVARLALTDPHGDTTTTVTLPASGSATSIEAWSDHTEYGLLRAGATAVSDQGKYGWLGSEERSADTGAELILMGARVYSPVTGRFTSSDPVVGGNENSYVYPNDPVNVADVSGLSSLHGREIVLCSAERSNCKIYVAVSAWAYAWTLSYVHTNEGNRGQAFRHIIWSALLTVRMGATTAWRWMNAHETAERDADYWRDMGNNQIGVAYGRSIRWTPVFLAKARILAYAWKRLRRSDYYKVCGKKKTGYFVCY